MTRTMTALRCVLVCTVATAAMAQSQPSAKQAESPLAPIAWLVGGIWTSDIKDPGDGSVTHVENHITWAPNRQAIEFVTDFNGKPHYNGFYAFEPVKKAISFYYTSGEGQLTIGTATPDPDGKTQHIKSTLARDGSDAYDFTVFMQDTTGAWAQAFKIRYQRK